MGEGLQPISPPTGPVYRIGRAPNPFALPDWAWLGPDGTFGGRFDDPRTDIPVTRRFRLLYCATDRVGAFAESIGRFRVDMAVLATLAAPAGSRLERPAVPASWRAARLVGATMLAPYLPIVDVLAPESIQNVRVALAAVAVKVGLPDIDVSALTGQGADPLGNRRTFTQQVARYVYEQVDPSGQPRYSGIRYLSRYTTDWECWALFADRCVHRVQHVGIITAHDPGLLAAAAALGLRIELDAGGRYLMP